MNYKIKRLDTTGKQLYIKNDDIIQFISYNTLMFTYDIKKDIITFNDDEDNYTKTTCKYLTIAIKELNQDIDGYSKYLEYLLYRCTNKKRFILNCNIVNLESKI